MGYPPQYGQPSRGETGRGLVVMVVMAVGLAIGTVITVFMVFNPPSSPPSTSSTPGGEHSETSVRQAVQPALDAYSSGSYGDFWDLWTTEAQGLIAREEYVRLFEICPPILPNSPLTIAGVTITGDNARVEATRLDDATDFDFAFESGTWRYEPSAEERLTYQAPVDRIAEQRRAMGFCGAVTPTPGAPTPTGPANPIDPTVPGNPTVPSSPADPSVPGVPTVPTNPADPSVPGAPTAPANPGDPLVPTVPTNPTTQPPGFLE
ncbi:hypothetical protein GCM10022252_08540 [Streptosporangium oxazolinicum]|uniref:Uncharacterized protein n=1 Tax=Streptosporangium oxazolinicum TaxID=909287 RepID=A0ABP8AE81_9ACTN